MQTSCRHIMAEASAERGLHNFFIFVHSCQIAIDLPSIASIYAVAEARKISTPHRSYGFGGIVYSMPDAMALQISLTLSAVCV
jgi:hypothetical protein